ncbi:MAG: ABC transporter substrate-binding protein [Pseudolabrys sp.]|nr:ABC transporter substrate-binding protein [Pseudolabrys sp.]
MGTVKYIRTILLTLAVVLTSATITSAQTKVTLAFIGITASNWPGLVARDKGFFKDEGLDVDWVLAGQSSKVIQLVMAGAANMGNANTPDSFRPIDGGGDVVIFMNALAQGIHSLVGSKSVKTVNDLKGKRVIVGGQKDITALWWAAMARKKGMDPSADVQLLFSGSTGSRMAALASGGVDAAVLGPPVSFKAFEEGYTDLGPIASYLGEFPMNVHIVNRTWAIKNKATVVSFVRAVNRATQYMLDPKNKTEVSEILAKASSSSLENALSTYDLAMKVNGYPADGSISASGMKRVMDKLAEDGDLKQPLKPPSAFYDPQFVEAARTAKP